MKRLSRIIAAVVCASWASSGLAYTFNPIGDIYWSKPVLSSLPDDWQALITESQNVQDSGSGSGSNCDADGNCTDSSSGLDFSGGADLIGNGDLGFSGGLTGPGAGQLPDAEVQLPSAYDPTCDLESLRFSGTGAEAECPSGGDAPDGDPPDGDPPDGDPPDGDPPGGDPPGGDPPGGDPPGGDPPGGDPPPNGVSAPASLALMGLGLLLLGYSRRKPRPHPGHPRGEISATHRHKPGDTHAIAEAERVGQANGSGAGRIKAGQAGAARQ